MSSDEFEARAELWFNLRAAAHRYYAQPLDVAAHLFTAHPPEPSDPANGWSAVLRGRLQVHPIGGDHWSIMMDPARAGRVGSAISSILAGIDRAAKPAEPALHASAVVIRTGSARTRKVFCIPGAGANATSFLDLCARFAGDASFIGLEAAGFLGLDGTPPPVQEAARRYVEAIRSMQPAGPYHLLGHSFGGWIALEIARQLIEAGAVVAPLVLVDTQAPRAHGHAGGEQAMHEYVKLIDLNIGAGLGVSVADLAGRDQPSQVLLVFEKMKQAGVLPARARLEDFEPVIEMFCRQCGIGYQAEQPFGGLPLLFCAAPAAEDDSVDLDAWQRLEPGLRAVHVDGSDHLSILKPPHAARLVEEIGKHWYLG